MDGASDELCLTARYCDMCQATLTSFRAHPLLQPTVAALHFHLLAVQARRLTAAAVSLRNIYIRKLLAAVTEARSKNETPGVVWHPVTAGGAKLKCELTRQKGMPHTHSLRKQFY